jgi:hypothetical protein
VTDQACSLAGGHACDGADDGGAAVAVFIRFGFAVVDGFDF